MRTFGKVWVGIGLIAIGLGIVLLILAAGSERGWRSDIPTYSMEESYRDVETLDIKIAYGEVTIKEGDNFHIEGNNLHENGFESYVSDGIWSIREDEGDYYEIFGIQLPTNRIIQWEEEYLPEIIITIPEGFIAEHISLDIGAGYIRADTIRAKSGLFTVGAGKMDIDQLQVSEESEYHVGAGEMVLQQLKVNDITVEGGVGSIVMEGIITGGNSVSCGIGSIDMSIDGDIDDYSYKINSGIGSIRVNNKSYHNIERQIIKNEDARNRIDLDCGIGKITVEIN